MEENSPEQEYYSTKSMDTRAIFGFIVSTVGLATTIISAKPEWVGQNRSPVIGFIQLVIMLAGLALLSMGGFISLNSLWGNREKSIVADFGIRFISTGYVIALFAGLFDIFGGNMAGNSAKSPQFGPYEEVGLEIGLAIIIVGLLMMIPYKYLSKTQKKETAL